MDQLRYPIGKFGAKANLTPEETDRLIRRLEEAPTLLREAVAGLTEEQLNTPYRPGGWSLRQVVHHLADSHLNIYIRFKLALTEDQPRIKTYSEEAWAELHDYRLPIEDSLQLFEILHRRWCKLMKGMERRHFDRAFFHPDLGKPVTLAEALQLYAWHSDHHIAHITQLRNRMGWL